METNNQNVPASEPTVNAPPPVPPVAAVGQPAAVSDSKVYSIVGYVFPPLFFLPLVIEQVKHDSFARFHANQQLLLVIAGVAIIIINNVLMGMFWSYALFWPLQMVFQLAWLGIFVLQIMGIVAVVNNRMTQLPIVGHISLIK